MKDFAEEYLSQGAEWRQGQDPYLFLTPEVEQELKVMSTEGFGLLNFANVVGLAIAAPLQTVVTSLQLSVKAHKRIFQQPLSKSKQLAKTNTSLTIQEKRRMELAIRSGQEHKPYTAPVYEGYQGAIRGLFNQGPKAFYKGLFFRSIHNFGHFFAFTQITLFSNKQGQQQMVDQSKRLIKIYALQSLLDMALNFSHVMENRYILQNNIPEFRVFRNAHRVFLKMLNRKEIFTGMYYHLFANFIELIRLPFYLSLSRQLDPNQITLFYCCQLILYPFNTAFKRILCQHKVIPGMIPIRYSSVSHAARVILSQEGFKGLYRGLGLHHLSVALRLGVIAMLIPVIENYRGQE